VRPAEPAFRSVRIAPALGPLRRAEGRVAHPAGDIELALVAAGHRIRGTVTLPPGVSGTFEWAGRSQPLREGRQQVVLERSASPAGPR
jgi:alpha-L-rhamnosidase